MRIPFYLVVALEQEGSLFEAAQAEQTPVMAAFLADIFRPVIAMGAVYETDGQRRIDVMSLKKFFLGVMGWSPRVLWHEATLDDMQAAFEGYALQHGLLPKTPDKGFLQEMMTTFPDKEK